VPSAPTNPFNFHFLTFLLITKNGEKQQRKPRKSSRKPGLYLPRYAQRVNLALRYQAPPRTHGKGIPSRTRLNFISNLSFNHKGWGKTTTKTDVAVPVVGREPDMTRATGDPVNVVPSAPTNVLFNFHFLAFLLITKGGEKQQRKPR